MSEREFNVYRRMLQVRSVGASRRLCYCPLPKCGAVCSLDAAKSASKSTAVHCTICGHSFCFLCHEPWPPGGKHKCATLAKKQCVPCVLLQGACGSATACE